MSIDRNELFAVLATTPCRRGRWVVAGSAPMLATGLVDSIEDIDIVADSVAWAAARDAAERSVERGMFGDRKVSLSVEGVDVEIFDGWLGADAAEIIAEAIEIDGYPFMPLERVLDSKRRLRRPKDRRHIDILEIHLDQRPTVNGDQPTAVRDYIWSQSSRNPRRQAAWPPEERPWTSPIPNPQKRSVPKPGHGWTRTFRATGVARARWRATIT